VVLAGRAQAAAVLGPDITATPREFLAYSGGGGTVRGLPFQSLGVTVGGAQSGGQGFAALSAEARVRVNDSFSVAAFADAGLVTEGAFAGPSDWHAGAGLGLRYLTPVGPLRLDLATPVRRNATALGARRLQVYVGIGQAF
jgi:translocation and assembly module TamA